MERWVAFAVVSMVFAGFPAVLAKQGLDGISGELGLAIRTCYVFLLVIVFTAWAVPRAELSNLTSKNLAWLGLSGITTAVSWVFYYKAIKIGKVSTVVLIDKGSLVVAVILAWLFLEERITPRIALGGALIFAGLFVVSRK